MGFVIIFDFVICLFGFEVLFIDVTVVTVHFRYLSVFLEILFLIQLLLRLVILVSPLLIVLISEIFSWIGESREFRSSRSILSPLVILEIWFIVALWVLFVGMGVCIHVYGVGFGCFWGDVWHVGGWIRGELGGLVLSVFAALHALDELTIFFVFGLWLFIHQIKLYRWLKVINQVLW